MLLSCQVALQSGNIDSETGVDASFELVHEMSGKIRTGQWVGDCFLFTNEVCKGGALDWL